MDIFADVTLNPTFPQDEFDKSQRRTMIGLLQRKDNANAIAGVAYDKVLYGAEHPYGVSISEQSVKAMKREDAAKFFETYFRPNNATLVVVGEIDMKTLVGKTRIGACRLESRRVPRRFSCGSQRSRRRNDLSR